MSGHNLDGGAFNQGSTSIQDGVFDEDDPQNQMGEYGEGVENGADEGNGNGEGEEDEGESVYMIDGVVMRMI